MNKITIYYGSDKIGSVEYDDTSVTLDIPKDDKYSVLNGLLAETLPTDEDSEDEIGPGDLEHTLLALKEASYEDDYTYEFDADNEINNSLSDVAENGGPGSGNFGHAGRPGQEGGSAGKGGSGKPSKSVLSGMISQAKANGGMTTDIAGNSPKEGIAFAPRKDTETIISGKDFDEKALNSFVDKHWDTLKQEGMHIGGWYNNDDGNWYLDISKVGPYNKSVIQEAQDAEQLAVFDLKTFKEIKTGEIKDGKYTKTADAETIFGEAFGGRDQGGVQNSAEETDEAQDEIVLNKGGGNPYHDKEGKFTTGPSMMSIRTADKGDVQHGESRITDNGIELGANNKVVSMKLTDYEKSLFTEKGLSAKFVNESEYDISGMYGEYSPTDKTLRLNAKHIDQEGMASTFYHELGHGMSHVERGNLAGVESYPENMFKNVRSKYDPLYAEKQSITRHRLAESLKSTYKLNDNEIAGISDKAWKDIMSSNIFVAVHKDDGSFARPYYIKSRMKYIQQADEVFADGYGQYRTDPAAFITYAPVTASKYKELAG